METNQRIALIYSTTEGHTRKIADHLATFLREKEHAINVIDVREIPTDFSLLEYDAVILGGSIHAGNFARPLKKFVEEQRDRLMGMAGGFFSVSLSAAEEIEEKKEEVQRYFDVFVEETGWHPLVFGAFAGAMPFSRYGFLKRMLMRSIGRQVEKGQAIDTKRDYEYTDWVSVEEFGEQFLRVLAEKQGKEDKGGKESRVEGL